MALAHHPRDIPDVATPIPHSLRAYSLPGALTAGALAALVFSGLLWLARLMGITNFSIAEFLGSLFTRDTGGAALALGLAVHVMFGALVGLIYAVIFHAWGWATWARGVAIAIPHAIVGGGMLAALGEMHPLNGELTGNPGFLGGNYGWLTAATLMGLFLIFGAITGAVYAHFVPHLSPANPDAAINPRE
ncbi:MAG TPA: hypothetical protein VD997_01180 [Phycisphaerales bacterium]|nr:hypothetical protein [Phycisphaerales bacterium]